MLPLLDLLGGASEPPAHDWGLHPFFERLLREQRSPGQKARDRSGSHAEQTP